MQGCLTVRGLTNNLDVVVQRHAVAQAMTKYLVVIDNQDRDLGQSSTFYSLICGQYTISTTQVKDSGR
jgi:hypothetical protein